MHLKNQGGLIRGFGETDVEDPLGTILLLVILPILTKNFQAVAVDSTEVNEGMLETSQHY